MGAPEPSAEEKQVTKDQDELLQQQKQDEEMAKKRVEARELATIQRLHGSGMNAGTGTGFSNQPPSPVAPSVGVTTLTPLATNTSAQSMTTNPDGEFDKSTQTLPYQSTLQDTIG